MEKKLKYVDIYEDLREQILHGRIRPGERLSSENELAAAYSVSRQTVRKALEILQDEGFIYAQHGCGTFCSELMGQHLKSKNIAVVTTYLSDYIFPRVIQGIDWVLTQNGYSILLKNTKNSRGMEARCLEELLQKNIDGLIIEPSKSQIMCRHLNLYEMLDAYEIPYVFIQGSYDQLKDKPHILMDDCRGGYLVTEHLIAQGRRDLIGLFKADDTQGQQRHKGYVQALQAAGIAYDPDKVVWFYTEDRKSHPYEKLKQLIDEREQLFFDGVVCYNDQIALQVLRALEEKGVDCPGEVAVTGYDDSYLASTCRVPLTTVSHPQEKLGEMAAGLLLELIRDPAHVKQTQIVIEPQLIVRRSSERKDNL